MRTNINIVHYIKDYIMTIFLIYLMFFHAAALWQAAEGASGKDRAPTCCRPVSRVEVWTSSVCFRRVLTKSEDYEMLLLAITVIVIITIFNSSRYLPQQWKFELWRTLTSWFIFWCPPGWVANSVFNLAFDIDLEALASVQRMPYYTRWA